MEIVLKNCNNIDNAKVVIEPNRLNIKYGINGTGKSSIVKSIHLSASGGNLSELTPFKYQKNKDSLNKPCIEGLDNIKSVAVFNEEYVSQFVFKQDEVVNNSFEIFIRTKEYDQKMLEIENMVSNIKETFKNDERLEQVIRDLTALSDSFGKPAKTGIHGSASIAKGIGKGNKLEHIPEALASYAPFLKMQNNVKWIGWQIQGSEFLDTSNDCPYCTSPAEDKKETILAVKKEYDAKSIEHLNKILTVLDGLGKYLSKEASTILYDIVRNKDGLSNEQTNFLLEVKKQIDVLQNKLIALRELSFFSFKEGEKVQEKVSGFRIDLTLLAHMKSYETQSIVDNVNQSLNVVLDNIGRLQGQINIQRDGIKKTIQKHKTDINGFLQSAGYQYYVDIEEDGDSYKMRLMHKDFDTAISNSSKHLSYGEKNAFSLVLFMYECLSKGLDLIILDDPISSFDRHKKFAIIEMLFRRSGSFKGKTVLMMTHDLEPLIDIMGVLWCSLQPTYPVASFLENKSGVISEIGVTREDIVSFAQVCQDNIADQRENIIKLIYLRRYYEILDNKGDEYHILSSLFHKRESPSYDGGGNNLIHENNLQKAVGNIQGMVQDFAYESTLELIKDDDKMIALYHQTRNKYEKLQMFRIIIHDDHHEDSVIQKFINETYHIENEYVMQLNPAKYDFIPQYIVDECDKRLHDKFSVVNGK